MSLSSFRPYKTKEEVKKMPAKKKTAKKKTNKKKAKKGSKSSCRSC